MGETNPGVVFTIGALVGLVSYARVWNCSLITGADLLLHVIYFVL
jgi:hypothetical protein